MKIWKMIFYLLGLLPLGYIISMITFYLHTRVLLGFFPKYNQPDPKTLEIYQDYLPFINWTGNIWFVSLIIWIIMTITYIVLKRKKTNWRPLIFNALIQFCAIGLFVSGIGVWFAD